MTVKIIESPSRALSEFIIVPGYMSRDNLPETVDLSSPITSYEHEKESKIRVNIPFLSAAMQSVTGYKMAIAMAKEGGLGVIYCSQPVDGQAEMVEKVKKYKAGFVEPDVFSPETPLKVVMQHVKEKGYSTFPITEDGSKNGVLAGLLTKNDFSGKEHEVLMVKDRMIPFEKLIYAEYERIGDNLKEANRIMLEGHHGSLPIIDREKRLKYIVFRKDIENQLSYPLATVDEKKRYMTGAAINTRDYMVRVPKIIDAGADVLFMDTSQGFSDYVADALRFVKQNFPSVPIVGGNIVTGEGFLFLAENGADAVKVGMGPGSICITIEQIGVGMGQGSAVYDVSNARDEYFRKTKKYVPIISDGGIVIAKDIEVALALGADSVMMGRYLAGCDETPTEVIERTVIKDGKKIPMKVKLYWGEGSKKSKEWMDSRYGQQIFDEGVMSRVPYVGDLHKYLEEPIAKIKDGIRKSGSRNLKEFHNNAVLRVMSPLSVREAGEHDLLLEEGSEGG